MNKFKLLAIVLMMGVTSLFASSNINPDISKDEIRKQIIELVQDSSTSLETQTFVKVTFTFNTEGEIVVLKVSSRDKEILTFIRENLNSKKLENPGKVNRHYTMGIDIK
ncbi:hypothetical protein [Lutibacter flavus]|uniref:TonB protein C-terminal n=1 Tax=Lutibacter flavus TaxID=691689 RepID=A0A238X670_9FLAO|nr:hypothetical protein [Lutibacter flavus]SNR54122.1 hypothetical protein SAMN04488111_1595 [Lutibacter flavus]